MQITLWGSDPIGHDGRATVVQPEHEESEIGRPAQFHPLMYLGGNHHNYNDG